MAECNRVTLTSVTECRWSCDTPDQSVSRRIEKKKVQNNPVYEAGNLDDETISDKILDENYFKWGDKVFLKTPLAGVNEQSALIKPLAAARLPNKPRRRRRFQNQMDYGAIILKYI